MRAAKSHVPKPSSTLVRPMNPSSNSIRTKDPARPSTATVSLAPRLKKPATVANFERAIHPLLQVNDLLTVILRFLCPWIQWRVATSSRRWMEALLDILRNPEPGQVSLLNSIPHSRVLPHTILGRRLAEISNVGLLLYSQQRAMYDSHHVRLCTSCGDLHSIKGNDYQVLLRASPTWRRWYRPRTTFLRSPTAASVFFLPCPRCRKDPRICSREVSLKLLQELRELLENPASRFDHKEKFRVSAHGGYWSKMGANGILWEEGNCGFGQGGVDVNLDGWCIAPASHILLGYDFDGPRLAPHRHTVPSVFTLPYVTADSPLPILRLIQFALNEEYAGERVVSAPTPSATFSATGLRRKGEPKGTSLRLVNPNRTGGSTPYQLSLRSIVTNFEGDTRSPPTSCGEKHLEPAPASFKDEVLFHEESRLSAVEARRSGYCFSWNSELGLCRLGIITSVLRSLQAKVRWAIGGADLRALRRGAELPSLIQGDECWVLLLTLAATFYEPPYSKSIGTWAPLT